MCAFCLDYTCFTRGTEVHVLPQPFFKSNPGHEGQTGQLCPFILTGPRCFRRLGLSASSYHDTPNSAACRSCFVLNGSPKDTCSPGAAGGGLAQVGGPELARREEQLPALPRPPPRHPYPGLRARPPPAARTISAAASFDATRALGSAWPHKHGRAQRGGGAGPGAAAVERAVGVGPPFFPPPFPSPASPAPAAGRGGRAGRAHVCGAREPEERRCHVFAGTSRRPGQRLSAPRPPCCGALRDAPAPRPLTASSSVSASPAPVRLMPGGHPEQAAACAPAAGSAPERGSPAATVPGGPAPAAAPAGTPVVRGAAPGVPRPVAPKGPPTATLQLPANLQLPPGE